MPNESHPLITHRDAILMAAGEIYHAAREDREPHPDRSRVNALPQALGSLSTQELQDAEIAVAELNVYARVVARMAHLHDDIEQGGLRGTWARTEVRLSRICEGKYLGPIFETGLIDLVRGRAPEPHS